MTAGRVDFAVVGSTPLAVLVAGLLAGQHRKSVALVAERQPPFSPPAGFDAAVGVITRPETWALLRTAVPETTRIIRGFARHALRRADCDFRASAPEAIEALFHVRHLAAGFGHAVERVATRQGAIFRVRDAFAIDRERFFAAATAWHARLGIRARDALATGIALHRDGAVLDGAGGRLEADRVFLADDEAILTRLDAEALPPELQPGEATAILLDAPRPFEAALEHHADAGVTFGRVESGLCAFASGSPEAARERVAATLGNRIAWVAGMRPLRILATGDGAPAIGRVRSATFVAGLGFAGAFLAPTLARHLAGAPGADEERWLAARAAGRARGAVAEPQPQRAWSLAS